MGALHVHRLCWRHESPAAQTGISIVSLVSRPFVYVYMYACIYVSMHVCHHVCMYVCVCVCVYLCMYACMHMPGYIGAWNTYILASFRPAGSATYTKGHMTDISVDCDANGRRRE